MAAPAPQRNSNLLDYLKEPPFLIVYVGCTVLFFGLTIVNAMNAPTSQGALAGTVIYGLVFLVFFGGVIWILPQILCKRGSGTSPTVAPPSVGATAPQQQAIPITAAEGRTINVANPMRTP